MVKLKSSNLSFPKIQQPKSKETQNTRENKQHKIEKAQKNSAINAPIWYNVNNDKNTTQKEHIAL